MVFLATVQAKPILLTIGQFGVQHADFTETKKSFVATLYKLLSQSADRLDHFQDENLDGSQRAGPPISTTFVAYWLHSSAYEAWKSSEPVKAFWASLPDDAGVWREVMTVPQSRFTHQSDQDQPSGFGAVVGLTQSSDEGYWGVNRHRLSVTPDEFTAPDDTFVSDYVTTAKAHPDPSKKVIEIPSTYGSKIRLGRVRITNPPDNLAFFRDGQRLPGLPPAELATWREKLSPLVRSWIGHLNTERNKRGVLSITTHIGRRRDPLPPIPSEEFDPAAELGYEDGADGSLPETNQLGYFLDLAHFELAGRSFKDHVTLVKSIFQLYGPGGAHGTGGKLFAFAELAIVKGKDLDAEYIGCKEGTGLMLLADLSDN